MEIVCHGGMLDGHVVKTDNPEPTIHQNGLLLLRVHQPYPKRQGEKITEILLAYTEDFTLHTDPDAGLTYRCAAPFGGVTVGGATLTPTEGGGFDVYADRSGKLHAVPPEAA